MKLGVLQTFYLFATAEWMVYTWSANHLERQYRLPPLLGGCLVHLTTATLLTTEDGRLLSV
jgi:hypothetical protein